MDSRNEDSIINFANLPWTMPPVLSYEAAFSRIREKLAKLVMQCGLFDTYTLRAFANTREAKGTYRIDAGDPLLISTVKCVINIFYCLEIMKPSLFDPFTSYLQSDTWLLGSIHYFSFMSNYTYQRTRIMKEFKFYVRFLQYYLDQLEKNNNISKIIKNDLITAVITLGTALRAKTQPFIDAIPISQILLSEYDEQPQDTKTPNETSATIADICDVIDECRNKITAFITSNDASIKVNPSNDLFAEDITEHTTLKNLIHAVNTLTRFKKALKKVDRVINHYELNLIDVCTELGNVIKELQKININSIKKIYITEFIVLLETIIKKLEPILKDISRVIDLAELNLGINSGLLQNIFANLFHNYQVLANTLKTPLQERYPHWQHKLELQELELKRKQDLKKQVIEARKIIKKIQINDKTSLLELLIARKAARQISTPNMYYYEKEINLLIAAHTGLGKLNDDIEATENVARVSTGGRQHDALNKLQLLYALRLEFEARLKKIETENILSIEPFSYDHKTQSIVPRPFPKTWLGAFSSPPEENIKEPRKATLQTADELINGFNHDCERLYSQIICAENILIANHNAQPQLANIEKIRIQIIGHTFLSLFLLSANELKSFLKDLQSLHLPETQHYENMIEVMLHEKIYGPDFLHLDPQDRLLDHYHSFAEVRYNIIRFLNHFFIPPTHIKIEEAKKKPSTTVTSAIAEKETHEHILDKINDKFKGSIVLTSALSRKKIVTLLTQFLSNDEYAKLYQSLMSNGLYSPDLNDPILIKTIKSLLNSLLRFEEVLIQIQPHARNIAAGKGHATFAVYGLPATHAAFLAFKLELNDFFYYLSSLNTAFPLLAEVYKLPVFGKILNLASKVFTIGKNIFFAPEVASLLDMDHISNINQGLIKLDEMAQATDEANLDLVFSPIESATTVLDKLIEKFYGVTRTKNSFQTKDANNDENLKDLLIVANTLSKTSKTLQRLVAIADKGAVGDFIIVAANSFDIYKKLRRIYNNRIIEIKTLLKDLIEHIHPLLIQLNAHIEMMEIKFGAPMESFATKLKESCEQFEKLAEKFNVKFPSYYPYAYEKIAVMTKEMSILRKEHLMLVELQGMLVENKFNNSLIITNFSLKNLVFMRDALHLLPPSLTFQLLREINIAIERRTGLVEVRNQSKACKRKLRSLNNEISKLKKDLADASTEKTVVNNHIKRLNQCLDKLDKLQFLSAEDFALLYEIFINDPINTSQPFTYFLQLLENNIDYFRIELTFAIRAYEADLVQPELTIASITTQIAKKQTLSASIQADLQQCQQIETTLLEKINQVSQANVLTEFKYSRGMTYDNDFNAYTGGPISFDAKIIDVLSDYRKILIEKLLFLEAKHSSMIQNQQNNTLAMLAKSKQSFSDIEKILHLEANVLSSMVPSKITDIKRDTLLAYDLTHTRGFLTRCMQHFFGSIPDFYASILDKPESALVLAREIVTEAANHTSDVGIYLRNLFSKRTANDNFYMIAQYWYLQLKSKLQVEKKSPLLTKSIFDAKDNTEKEKKEHSEDKLLLSQKKT